MSLETSLVAGLQTDPSVSGMIGTRVFPLVVPQNAVLPAIAYQVITGSGIVAHDAPTSLMNKRVQFACVGSDYASAVALADAVVNLLRGYKGVFGAGVQVEFAEDVNQTDGLVDEYPAGYVRYIDVMFLHKNGG